MTIVDVLACFVVALCLMVIVIHMSYEENEEEIDRLLRKIDKEREKDGIEE